MDAERYLRSLSLFFFRTRVPSHTDAIMWPAHARRTSAAHKNASWWPSTFHVHSPALRPARLHQAHTRPDGTRCVPRPRSRSRPLRKTTRPDDGTRCVPRPRPCSRPLRKARIGTQKKVSASRPNSERLPRSEPVCKQINVFRRQPAARKRRFSINRNLLSNLPMVADRPRHRLSINRKFVSDFPMVADRRRSATIAKLDTFIRFRQT